MTLRAAGHGGPWGGPFVSDYSDQLYAVSNDSTWKSVNWTVSCLVDWLTVTPAGGTLAPGATVDVRVVPNEKAEFLDPGTYVSVLSLTNVDTLKTYQNSVSLDVYPVAQLVWDAVSCLQSRDVPFETTIRATDVKGRVCPAFNGNVTLTATHPDTGTCASSIVLSEIGLYGVVDFGLFTDSYIEIQNVADQAVDTTGWVVAVGDSHTDINFVNSITWALPPSVGAGETLCKNGIPGDPIYWGGPLNYKKSWNGWAMILNGAGEIVDFAAWGWSASDIAAMHPVVKGRTITIGPEWSGPGIATAGAQTIQRQGYLDRNLADDFAWIRKHSYGQPNTGLIIPFGPREQMPITPNTCSFVNGVWSGQITPMETADGVLILADAGSGVIGISGRFDVIDPLENTTVSKAKTRPVGSVVTVVSAIVTSTDESGFYIESRNRSSGIRVNMTESGRSIGEEVWVHGRLAIDANGECCIEASSVLVTGVGDVAPLAMSSRALGGGTSGIQAGVWGWQTITESPGGAVRRVRGQANGLNNIGLLVRLSGRVVEVEPVDPPALPTWFKLDDGTDAAVKCVVPEGVQICRPPEWTNVTVTGISSCEMVGEELHRVLRVREQSDIVRR